MVSKPVGLGDHVSEGRGAMKAEAYRCNVANINNFSPSPIRGRRPPDVVSFLDCTESDTEILAIFSEAFGANVNVGKALVAVERLSAMCVERKASLERFAAERLRELRESKERASP